MMKIAEIVEVGDKKSLIRLEDEMCDRILDNETIVDIYMRNHGDDCIFPKTKKKRMNRKEYTKRTIIEIIEKYYL